MTQTAVYYDSTGEIVDVYAWDDTATTTDFDTLTPTGGGYALDDEADPDRHYYTGTPKVRTDRPQVADSAYAIASDGTANVTFAMPSGTVVTPDYPAFTQQTSAAENFVFTSTIRGVFTFSIDPPFPYVHQVVKVYVDVDNL